MRVFVQRTKAIESAVHARISTIPSAQRILATNHDAFGYFADSFGLKVISVSGVSTEAAVTPGRLRKAIESIRKTGVKAIFLETAASPETIRKVAVEAGVRLGGELYADGLSAPDKPASTIAGLWETNAETIVAGLKP
jgi:zinc/manganese transport system substrate-binding protein